MSGMLDDDTDEDESQIGTGRHTPVDAHSVHISGRREVLHLDCGTAVRAI